MRSNQTAYDLIAEKVCTELYENLPKKPYCAHEKGYSLIRTKVYASNHKYIQINYPNLIKYLIIDIDEADSYSILLDSGLPQPTYISVNRQNGHLQCAWKLADAVSTSYNSRLAPMRFLKAIEAGFRTKLKGDLSFGGCLAKNPLHEFWSNEYCDTEYSLHELADFVDLSEKDASYKTEAKTLDDENRNDSLFNVARHWAYNEIRTNGKKPMFETWRNVLIAYCEKMSEKFTSLVNFSYNEIKGIALSIARFTFKNWNDFVSSAENFSRIQAEKGKKGGAKSKRGASPQKAKLMPIVRALANDKNSHRVIATLCKISASTVSRWLTVDRAPIHDA